MIEQREGSLSIAAMCEVLDVSPSGYHAWCKRGPSLREQADEQLGCAVERVFLKVVNLRKPSDMSGVTS